MWRYETIDWGVMFEDDGDNMVEIRKEAEQFRL
jgi:hypothetical protein